jgi:putative aldouronate transport system permease protein
MNKQAIEPMDIIIILVTVVFTFLCFYPFWYVFINSISDNDAVNRGDVTIIPLGIHIRNYLEVFKMKRIPPAMLVSFARTAIGTVFTVLSSSLLGFCMIKKEYWHRKFWYRFLIVTMYFNAGVIPWYLLMVNLHLTNNFLGYILPALVSPFNMILIKTYMESIPASLDESAEIDGAGYLKRYFKIAIPLTKPILATVAVFSAVGQWNAFMDTVFLMTDSRYFTLQFLLYRLLNEAEMLALEMRDTGGMTAQSVYEMTPMGIRFTVTMVTLIPIIMVYPFLQRYFIKGIMIGAIKG